MWNYLISKDRTEQKTEKMRKVIIFVNILIKVMILVLALTTLTKKMVVLITLEVNDINDRISRKVTVRIIMINDYKWSCW